MDHTRAHHTRCTLMLWSRLKCRNSVSLVLYCCTRDSTTFLICSCCKMRQEQESKQLTPSRFVLRLGATSSTVCSTNTLPISRKHFLFGSLGRISSNVLITRLELKVVKRRRRKRKPIPTHALPLPTLVLRSSVLWPASRPASGCRSAAVLRGSRKVQSGSSTKPGISRTFLRHLF